MLGACKEGDKQPCYESVCAGQSTPTVATSDVKSLHYLRLFQTEVP